LVSAALDQSEIVATVPRDQIQLALQQAGKPTNTRVSAEVARELAYRRAVRAVLEGDIQRIGRGYSVVLRVVDAESLKVVLTERGSAKDEDALIPALGKMAEKLREGLGERRSAVAATRPMTTGVTPSFEAYRLFVEATGLFRSGDMDGAIALYDAALRLDPGFCMAWFNLALAESNMGRVDSVQVAYEQAGRTSERLTATGRLRLEATRTLEGGDLERALAMYSGLVQMNPGDIFALSQTANILTSLGRFEEALARTQECERRSAFGATTVMLINEVEFMLNLGRVEAARERVSRIVGISAAGMRSEVELAACNWATAESIAAAQTQDLGIGTPRRLWALARLASAKGGRGSLRAADATLRQLGQVAGRDWLDGRVQAWRARLFLADETRGAIELPPDSWADDTSTAVLLLRGMRAAQAGDQAAAARLLKAAQTRSARELAEQGAAPQLLEARVKALAGRWEEAVDILQPIGGQTIEVGPVRYGAGLPAVRCLLADAFVKLGRPDSAAVYLERTTTDVAFLMSWTGISVPLAHQRLVLLYTRMGRLADAERHLAILERWWDKPDDIARRMLEDARAAVASARSMARPERPRT
jgi:tetratricopeptide (TPR) repeat protein